MSVLDNPKHEAFAQYLSEGKTADEAYQLAGYAANRGNAIRLKTNERVMKRVEELQERHQKQNDITVSRLSEMLLSAHERAVAAADLTNERQAVNDLAKLHGLIVTKSEVARKRDITELDDSEIDALIASSEGGEGAEAEGPHEPSQLH